MRLRSCLLASASVLLIAAPAAAETRDDLPQAGPTAAQLPDVIVTADPLGRDRNEVVSNVAVLTGDDLVHRRQGTLGETLNGLPGVNADPYGGGAGRPVVRGQTAPRVKVLSDGVGLLDASEVSPDHAVAGEPLLLQGIEILRGPSALLYGGGAIGGAVNLIDNKVPTAIPVNGGEGVIEARLGTADDEEAGVVGLTAGAGNFAIRVEAAGRKTADYKVPDFEEARLDGTFNETSTATLGLSWIGSRGYLGAAYTEQRSRYGLPGHAHEFEDCHPHGDHLHCGGHDDHDHDDDHHDDDHDHDHDHEEHGVPFVDLLSKRVDIRGELRDPFAGVERIRVRGGFTDYRHQEIEDGEVGTTFTNKGHDARVEVQHAPIAGFRGVVGFQTSRSDFAAVGDEAFLPPSRTDSQAVFLLEEKVIGDWRLEGAVRQEWQQASADGQPDADHSPFSISGAASWRFSPGWTATLALARSQRAPSAQELYADGVHLATNTFEIGDANLDVETSYSAELTLKRTQGALTLTGSAYRYNYDGYIFARTLDQFEEFRLIQYSQADASFTGVEGEARWAFRPGLSAAVFGDYVRAEFDEGGDLPRIPAARLGVRGDFYTGAWSGGAEYVRVFEQNDIAPFETVTPGYNMINATLAYDLNLGPAQTQIYVRGTNLLDEKAFNHASYLADVQPLRGRNFVVGVRARF
ncbi:MAG: TonB-dependent receptor domain-containing protein [Brevundimonas sp.]|uniref:TonB-dependent receptor domain-containing protein n=1 Tax=Brevundimonas sp. TaxID=1871086 RepID=UPI003918DBBF